MFVIWYLECGIRKREEGGNDLQEQESELYISLRQKSFEND